MDTTAETALKIEFNLDHVLAEKGTNMRQVAKKAGLSYPTVYGIGTNSQTRCDLLTLQKLAETLDVRIGELFRYK